MTRSPYPAVAAAVAALVAIVFVAPPASLLPALLFWSALLQGAVAVAATGDLTKAKWMAPIRPTLLAVHPFLLALPFGFLVYARGLPAGAIGWLHPSFLVARNVAWLLIVWLLAVRYARSVRRETGGRNTLALLYVVAFVVGQTLIAFDWVMALEYPWVSTLFGGYFFVEAFYAGLAVAAFAAARLATRERLNDAATLLFAFSLLWAGQFFAQYLVIWYGNLPHEVEFLARRVLHAPLRQLSMLALAMLFFVPFLGLLARRAKRSPAMVTAMGSVILAGIVIERIVFLAPVARINAVAAALAFGALGAPLIYAMRRSGSR
jgi:hypothetical protein